MTQSLQQTTEEDNLTQQEEPSEMDRYERKKINKLKNYRNKRLRPPNYQDKLLTLWLSNEHPQYVTNVLETIET